MVVRCSNPVGFIVVKSEEVPRTGIHLRVYSRADPATLLDLLPDTWDRQWTDELNGAGSASFKVHASNPRLIANPDLLAYGNVVRFELDRFDRFAMTIEHKSFAEVVDPETGEAGRVVTVTGRGILAKLEESVAYTQIDGNPVRGFPGITPGHLSRVLVDESTARGALAGIVRDYSDTLDSNGLPWTSSLAQTERAGTDLLRIHQRIAETAADVYARPDGTLQLFNSRGIDRTLPILDAEAVIIRPGANIAELTRDQDGAIRNVLLIETPSGFTVRSDGPSIAAHGRREAFLSLGNADDSGQLDLVAASLFNKAAQPSDHLTLRVSDAVIYPRPYQHWDVGDWVLAPDEDGELTSYRVRGLTVSESGDGKTIFVTPELSTVAEELQVRLDRWLAAMSRGTLGGTAAAVAEPIAGTTPEVSGAIATGVDDGVATHLSTSAHPAAFNDLTDVVAPTPAGGDLVQYGGAPARWRNVTLGSLGITTLTPQGRAQVGATIAPSKPGVDLATLATAALTANQIRYEPFLTVTEVTVDALLFEVTTAVAASNVRLAIYAADRNWQPLALIVDAGNTASATTGVKTVTLGSPVVLPAGRYLTASWSGHAPTLRHWRGGHNLLGVAPALGASGFIQTLTVTSTFGAYVDPGTLWTAANVGTLPFQHNTLLRVSTP